MASIKVEFRGGRGELKVCLYRDGNRIPGCDGYINQTGTIVLSHPEVGDEIVIRGISPVGGTTVTIDLNTDATTPKKYLEGTIDDVFEVITINKPVKSQTFFGFMVF